MANEITLKCKSLATWSKGEKSDLFDAFVEFIKDYDDDVLDESFSVEIVDENDVPESGVTDVQKKEIIEDFLDNTSFAAKVFLTNGDVDFKVDMK